MLRLQATPSESDFKYLAVRSFGAGGLTGELSNVVDRKFPPVAIADASVTAGKPPLAVTFSCSGSCDRDGTIVRYEWDFDGDGSFDWVSEVPDDTQYTYKALGDNTAFLRVTDDSGMIGTDNIVISVANQLPPVASLQADPTAGDAPLTVTFYASGSSDSDGSIVKYEWDWHGDGVWDLDSGSWPMATHTYVECGSHSPTVRVTDDDGATDSTTEDIMVYGPPVAVLAVNPSQGEAPLTVSFDPSDSYDPDGGGLTHYAWDWEGDGVWDKSSFDARPVSHTYSIPGSYAPVLRVFDDEGVKGHASAIVEVNHLPEAVLTAEPEDGFALLTVNFDASRSFDPDGGIVKYEWDWSGRGSYERYSESDPTFSPTYSTAGVYEPAVRVTDNDGSTDMRSVTIAVLGGPDSWVHTWGTSYYSGNDVVVDGSGNAYVVGRAGGGVLVLKYGPSGNPLWAKTWNGNYSDVALSVGLDDYGSLWVAGYTWSFGAGSTDVLVLRYDLDGNLVWARTWGGSNYDVASALTPDGSGGVYVVGGTESFGAGWRDALLLRYDSTGNLTWQDTWGGEAFDHLTSVAVDDGGNVYSAGYTRIPPFGNPDAVFFKYDGDGNVLWQRTWGDVRREERARGAALDGSGDLYVAGETGGGRNAFLVKLDPNGNVIWQRTWGGKGDYSVNVIAMDPAGSIYLAGRLVGRDFESEHSVDGAFLVSFSSSGDVITQRIWDSEEPEHEYIYGLAFDETGVLRICGNAAGATGIWLDMNGEVATISGSLRESGGILFTPDGTETSPDGRVSEFTGEEDGSKGGVLIMKYSPP